MRTILKWASWLVSAFAIYLLIFGCLAYLFGAIEIFGVKMGTYFTFASYFMPLAILLVLLSISCKEKRKE
jgi:hypothetical protein